MYGCFAYMYICAPLVYLVPTEVRRWYWVLRNWSYRWLWAIMWMLGIEPTCLEELLAVEPSLPPFSFFLPSPSFLSLSLFRIMICATELAHQVKGMPPSLMTWFESLVPMWWKKLTPTSCPLIFIHILWRAHTPHTPHPPTHTQMNALEIKLKIMTWVW